MDNNSKGDEIAETLVQDNNSAKSVKSVPKIVLPIFTTITWIRIHTTVPAPLVQWHVLGTMCILKLLCVMWQICILCISVYALGYLCMWLVFAFSLQERF